MNGTIRLLGVLTLLAGSASAAFAQAGATSWADLLAARTRVAYRYTHGPATGECGAVRLPETARLLPPGHGEPIGRTWLPGPNLSRWEAISAPSVTQPLDVQVKGLWCGPTGESLLVEADGYYLEVYANRLASVDELGTVTPGLLLAPDVDGDYAQVVLREECVAAVCQFVLTNANDVGHDVRLAVAQREEADRMRRAEADRRAEELARARIDAGANARAQVTAVSRRQQAEQLRSLGATAEQADAILQRRVLVGMSGAMVRAALGDPARVVAEPAGRQRSETWSYPGRQYILVDDRVTEIR